LYYILTFIGSSKINNNTTLQEVRTEQNNKLHKLRKKNSNFCGLTYNFYRDNFAE